jgi:probable HAF family extracellular repeat protein
MYGVVSIAFLSALFVAAGTLSIPSELPSIAGNSGSGAAAINDRGDIVGWSYNADFAQHATLWSIAGVPSDLGGGAQSEGDAVSSTGAIVGASMQPDGSSHATLWPSAGSAPVDLGSLGGMVSTAAGINTRGDMVGYSLLGDNNTTHAAFWTAGSRVPVDLGTLPGGTTSQALGINAGGDVVGWSDDATFESHAVLWPAATHVPVILKSLVNYSVAFAISDNGDAVGFSKDASFALRPVRWPAAGHMPVDLGTLGGAFGGANAINAAGDVAGYSAAADGSRHATLWPAASSSAGGSVPGAKPSKENRRSEDNERSENGRRSGDDKRSKDGRNSKHSSCARAGGTGGAVTSSAPIDLGLLPLGTRSEARAINASGQIVGIGLNSNGETRAMYWKPSLTPAPGPVGVPSNGQRGNHENEGEEDGDC